MEVVFSNKRYQLVITNHAHDRMRARNLTTEMIVDVIQTGDVKPKSTEHRFWVYKSVTRRDDNDICLSVAVEEPNLVVVTALVNWRPET